MTIRELEGFYKGKRVLVTGHTGFKGAWLCRILALAGAGWGSGDGVCAKSAYGSEPV